MLSRLALIALIVPALSAAEPDKLLKLRSSYDAALSRATAPLQRTYLQELEKLKDEYTRAAKLQEALAVDEEIKRLVPTGVVGGASPASTTAQAAKKELLEYLCSYVWMYSKDRENPVGAYEVIFLPNGTFTQPDPAAPQTSTWSWSSDGKGVVTLNNSGEIKYKLGDTLIEHPLREGSRWLIRLDKPLPAHVAK